MPLNIWDMLVLKNLLLMWSSSLIRCSGFLLSKSDNPNLSRLSRWEKGRFVVSNYFERIGESKNTWSERNSPVFLCGFGRTGKYQLLVAHSEKYSPWMPTSASRGPKHPSERHKHCLFTQAEEGPWHKNWLQWARGLAVHSRAPEGPVRWRSADAFSIFWWRRSQGQALNSKSWFNFFCYLFTHLTWHTYSVPGSVACFVTTKISKIEKQPHGAYSSGQLIRNP